MDTVEYYYTNDIGRKKRICISRRLNGNGLHSYVIWDEAKGEPCQSGETKKQDLVDFLAYYGITPDLNGLD